MKKIIRWTAAIVFVAGCIAIGSRMEDYYGTEPYHQPYDCIHHSDDTLRVAIIGDSWAYMHRQHDDSLESRIFNNTRRPAKVISYGICGLTSKEVYQSIFNNDSLIRILHTGADVCFVSVGINDSYKKMGADYYTCHTIDIIRFLLHNNIKPIIMEIPDYDIQKAYERQTYLRKMLRKISMKVTGSRLDCREDYRQALRKALLTAGLYDSISLLPVQKWPHSYYLPDGMHLNAKGYADLDSCLCDIISKSP